jgi:hypothetical protein
VRLKSGDRIYRPLIPLTLEGEEKLDVIAILDSGSDITVIPEEIALMLGIKCHKENEITGIGGIPIKSKEGNIRATFGKGHEIYTFDIPVLIPEKKDVAIIIGRAKFFEHFKITFSEAEKRIEFKKADISP